MPSRLTRQPEPTPPPSPRSRRRSSPRSAPASSTSSPPSATTAAQGAGTGDGAHRPTASSSPTTTSSPAPPRSRSRSSATARPTRRRCSATTRSHDIAVIKLADASGLHDRTARRLRRRSPSATRSSASATRSARAARPSAVGRQGHRARPVDHRAGRVRRHVRAADRPHRDRRDHPARRLRRRARSTPTARSSASSPPAPVVGAPPDDQTATQGYAVPIATAKPIADADHRRQVLDTVHIGGTAFLGVQVDGAAPPPAPPSGVVVAGTVDGSAAAKAGHRRRRRRHRGRRHARSRTRRRTAAPRSPRHHPGDRVSVRWTDAVGHVAHRHGHPHRRTGRMTDDQQPPAPASPTPFHPHSGEPRVRDRPDPLTAAARPNRRLPRAAVRRRATQAALLEDALFQIKRVVVGQDRLVERVLLCLLANGHCLIEGVPGLAKTLTVSTLSHVVGGQFSRVQFTPDLVPGRPRGHPHLAAVHRGASTSSGAPSSPTSCSPTRSTGHPRRCSPRCSRRWPSARSPSAATPVQLPAPFLVLATQNPIESEGVYALPEAQRDRFLMHVVVPQPTYEEEIGHRPAHEQRHPAGRPGAHARPARRAAGRRPARLRPPRRSGLRGAPRHGHPRAGPLGPRRTSTGYIALGASPRGTLGLISSARALAVLRGRRFVVPAGRLRRRARGAAAPRHASPTTPSPRACSPTTSSARCSATCPAPRISPQQDEVTHAEQTVGVRPVARPRPPDDRGPAAGRGLGRRGRRPGGGAAPARARGAAAAGRQRVRRPPDHRHRAGQRAGRCPRRTSRATTRGSSTGT